MLFATISGVGANTVSSTGHSEDHCNIQEQAAIRDEYEGEIILYFHVVVAQTVPSGNGLEAH